MPHHHSCRGWSGAQIFGPRGRGPRGFGRAFEKFGSDIMGDRGGFPFGRFVGDGELRLVVLALLAEAPRHGYDIIKALEERSGGFYSPSPGVIYPTLTYLEEAGFATAAPEGNKKVYSITPEGGAHLEENRETADAIFSRLDRVGRRLAQAREFFEQGTGRRRRGERGRPDVLPELDAARRALREVLIETMDAGIDEQRRVAEILRRAKEKISGRPDADEVDL